MNKLLLPVLLLLTACSGNPELPTTYLLRSDAPLESRKRSENPQIALGRVEVADYLDQGGLVLETGEGAVHSARQHRWSEPLPFSLRMFLATEISSVLGQDVIMDDRGVSATRVDLIIDQLHGTRGGDAVLVAYWRISGKEAQQAFQFSEREALKGEGYGALAQAEKALLSRLAGKMADSLRQLEAE